ncbi:MAG: hypothetical protein ACR2LC_00835 [Pyrinomonadaceae bacterium]
MQENEVVKSNDALAELTNALEKIFDQLKEINTSLKSIARSQAQQSTVQKRSSSSGG